jgi:hypothetical protein
LPVLGMDADHVGGLSEAQYPPLAELVTAYVAESRRCDEVVEAHGLDHLEASGPRTLRWVLHHLVEETARHLGAWVRIAEHDHWWGGPSLLPVCSGGQSAGQGWMLGNGGGIMLLRIPISPY